MLPVWEIDLRQRREHFRGRIGGIHFDPHFGNLALGIDEERVAVGNYEGGKRPQRSIGADHLVVWVREQVESQPILGAELLWLSAVSTLTPRMTAFLASNCGSASWNLCASMVHPVVMSLG